MFRNILKISILTAVLSVLAGNLCAQIYTPLEITEVKCAKEKMYLWYNYFVPIPDNKYKDYQLECRKSGKIKMPQWIDKSKLSMLNNMVWKDPTVGDISEALLWQTHISLLWEFFNITEKTLPKSKGGADIPPSLLIKEYADVKVRLTMSLDRIYRASMIDPDTKLRKNVMFDSMENRGRSLLPVLDLINKEMDSISTAIAANDTKKFKSAAIAIGVFSEDAFGQMLRPPRQTGKVERNQLSALISKVAMLAGMFLIFVLIKMLFGTNSEGSNKMLSDFVAKTKIWKEAFDRQFLKVRIETLVFVPIGVFGLAGLITFNPILFIILTGIGVVIGLKAPNFVLQYLKEKRGKQIDVQLMDALVLLSNSLKSGMDIVQGFELVSRDLQPPIAEEFGLVVKNYQLGTSFEKALEGMQQRIESRLLAYMIKAIVLQRQVGGNLTKIFERIVENIREESKLEEKTKALTAQQKIQSIVVGVMPWIMMLVMFVFQGKTMAEFYLSPIGLFVLFGCMIWIGIGMKIVSAMGKIRV